MPIGENPHDVTTRLKAKLEEIRPTMPPGMKVEIVYGRTELVDHVIDTVRLRTRSVTSHTTGPAGR